MELHSKLEKFSLEAGIPALTFQAAVKNLESLSFDALEEELAFLEQYRDGAYKDAKDYKSQKSDQWWYNLEHVFGNRKLPEQKILKEHYRLMRRAWKTKHKIPKKFLKAMPLPTPTPEAT